MGDDAPGADARDGGQASDGHRGDDTTELDPPGADQPGADPPGAAPVAAGSPDAGPAVPTAPDAGVHRTIFRAMVVEEWRMHAELFGPRRFAAFPVFVSLVAAGGVAFLSVAGVDPGTVVAGVHALVFLVGLQTGTVGFVGRDAMADLLGDVTLLLFSTRTLPVGRRRVLGLFVLKDLLYYAVLFMVPLSVAFAPAALAGAFDPGRLALGWFTLTATFALGIAVTLVLVALTTRGVPGRGVMVAVAVALGLAWVGPVDPVAVTPYALYGDPTAPAALAGLVLVPVLAALGVWLHDPEHERPARTAGDAFSRLRAALRDGDGLVARSLLDVHRSSGGLLKVVFSATVLFAVSAALVELLAPLIGTDPSTGVTFGALLGLSAFTTFNWLTQFDDTGAYLRLPLGLEAVFAAKLRAFLLLSVPVGLAFLALAVVLFGGRPAEVAAGVVLLVGLQVYLFGVVTLLAGFSPSEFLFDTVLFALFGVAVAAVLVPVLVVGLVVTPVPPALLLALAVAAAVAAVAGIACYRRAVPRWTRRHLAGEV